MIRTERKYIEILRILKEHREPVGAKRLSELMAERGFVLSDRAVQYYLSYLDSMGFTEKIGNQGRILTIGTPDEVKHHPDPLVQQFLHADFKRHGSPLEQRKIEYEKHP